jgi:hypothetical protein
LADNFIFYLCIIFALLLLPGTIWVLTRQSKFRISHMLLAMFLYCTLLTLAKSYLVDQEQQLYTFLFVAICLVPLTAGGIPIGVANENIFAEDDIDRRRFYFFAGFLTPISLIPFLVSTIGVMAVLADLSGSKNGILIFLIWLASGLPIAITLHGKYLKSKR